MARSQKWWHKFTPRSFHGTFHPALGTERSSLQGFWANLFTASKVGGQTVTERTAMGLDVLYRCVSLISQSIGTMPINKLTQSGNVIEPIQDSVVNLLKRSPNPNMTAFTFNELQFGAALLWGNGYSFIERDSNANPTALIPIHPEFVRPFWSSNDIFDAEIWYEVTIGNDKFLVKSDDMLHIRGMGTNDLVGISVLSYFNKNLGVALAADQYSVDFFNKGTILDGYIKLTGKLDEDAKKRLRDNWTQNSNQATGKSRTAILDVGNEYFPLAMNPADAQLLETRIMQDKKIATWFGVPLHMINQETKASKGTVEQNALEFLTYGLMPWIRKAEQEYWMKLLTERDKRNGNVFWKFNVDSILRADIKSRWEAHKIALQYGVKSINEIRRLEDMNPVENGDKRYVPLQNIDIDIATEFYASQIKENDGQQE